MRACFKNDNYYLATFKQKQKQKQKLIQKQKQKQLQKSKTTNQKRFNRYFFKQQYPNKEIKIKKEQQLIVQDCVQNAEDIFKVGGFKFMGNHNSHKEQIEQNQYESLLILAKIKKQQKEIKKTRTKQEELKEIFGIIQEGQMIKQIKVSQSDKNQQNLQKTNDKVTKQLDKKDNDNDIDFGQELKKLQIGINQSKNQQKNVDEVIHFKNGQYHPKSNLKIILMQNQQKEEQNKDRIKKQKAIKSQRMLEMQKKREQLMMKRQLRKAAQQNQQPRQVNDGNEDEEGQEKGKGKGKKDNKKIKKVNNYQRLDLKRKYKDRFVGGIRDNQRKYMKNGVLKPKYRLAQSELEIEAGQVYNTYIHSLSKAFHVQIKIDSDSQQESEILHVEVPKISQSSKQRLTELISEMFGFESFREGQFEVIENILNRQSTIYVSQTASGKSLTYILTALIMAQELGGMSIVISPLIALMLDQIQHLPYQIPAACISSLINYEQRQKILEMIKLGKVKILFMTPEMLMSDILFHVTQFPQINFVCIDQAHCLSELSHNFRTSYLALSQIIMTHIPYNTTPSEPNILCLTATANTETINSLCKKLQISKIIKSSSTINKNLFITITRQISIDHKLRSLVDYLNNPEVRKCQSVLIYCRAKYIIDKVFYYLSNSNIRASIFHGGLTNKEKTQIISKFKAREIKIIITTTALGMGLDFQHLDCVIHFNMTKSLESYVQEIGRAGRRQVRAYCHLFLDESDFFMQRNYILADELQIQSLKTIVEQIQKSRRVGGRLNAQQQQDKVIRQNHQPQDQVDRVIKKASLAIQQMQAIKKEQLGEINEYQSEVSEQEQEEDEDEHQSRLSHVEGKAWNHLYYMRVKQLSEKTYLRQEALLMILMKIAELLNQQIVQTGDNQQLIKIFPLSNEILKLSFFKNNEGQLLKDQRYEIFFKKIVGMSEEDAHSKKSKGKSKCKKVNGCYHIHLIAKCNQLTITPIELLSKVYEISNEYTMKVEFVNQVYVFALNERIKLSNKSLTFEDIKRKFNDKDFLQKIINEVNQIQLTTMKKLSIYYSLAFNYSQITVEELVRKQQIIPRAKQLHKDNIMNEITKYFHSDLDSFFDYLTEASCEQDREIFLPTEIIVPQEYQSVYQYIKLFFKHQFSNLRDFNNRQQAQKLKQKIISQYKDGKIITRIFLGVNEEKTSRRIYGDHSYWKKFLKKKYSQLLHLVRELIRKNYEDLILS